MSLILSLIAACSENRVIGRHGRLPWHLPADLRRFRNLTLDHPVIMGRRTFEALQEPLPQRTNIVITRQPDYTAEGAIVCHGLDEAIDRARQVQAKSRDASRGPRENAEVFIAGGGEIYEQALSRAHRLYITLVHATMEGDAFFPAFDDEDWTLITDTRFEPDDRHAFAYSFRRYERKGNVEL